MEFFKSIFSFFFNPRRTPQLGENREEQKRHQSHNRSDPPSSSKPPQRTLNRTSAVNFNIRALGKHWYINSLPSKWSGYSLLAEADLNRDNQLGGIEILDINWLDFVDAVIDFQTQQALTADGKLGPSTLKQLNQHYGNTNNMPIYHIGNIAVMPPSILTAPPRENIFFGDTPLERSIANIWNLYGNAIAAAAERHSIPIRAALGVFQVEAKNAFSPETGLMITRFEPHIFKRYTGQTITIEKRAQNTEWETLQKAAKIDETAALLSASYGLPQVVGFNWEEIGYNSPQDMFLNFQDSVIEQVNGFFSFVEKKQITDHIRQENWAEFVKVYNGPGNVPVYQKRLVSAMRSIEFLHQDGVEFIA